MQETQERCSCGNLFRWYIHSVNGDKINYWCASCDGHASTCPDKGTVKTCCLRR